MKFNDELKEPTMTYYDRLQEEIKRANKEAYKEGFREGFKEGFKESFKESFKENYKKGMQNMLILCIDMIFPNATKSLDTKIRHINEPKHLLALLKDALASASLATFENAVDATLQRQVQAT